MKAASSKGIFNLQNYKVKQFSLFEPPTNEDELTIDFEPNGIHNKLDNCYTLQIKFIASYGETGEKEFVTIVLEANFNFDESVKQEGIPTYFYSNSIAIVFPYIRAFVSTLSTLANIKPLIIPILNLNFLENILKENTIVVE
jgi:preprotein translocase subunit SecB